MKKMRAMLHDAEHARAVYCKRVYNDLDDEYADFVQYLRKEDAFMENSSFDVYTEMLEMESDGTVPCNPLSERILKHPTTKKMRAELRHIESSDELSGPATTTTTTSTTVQKSRVGNEIGGSASSAAMVMMTSMPSSANLLSKLDERFTQRRLTSNAIRFQLGWQYLCTLMKLADFRADLDELDGMVA
ncbi:hypothetical protein KDA14_02190, partial [Candidatus Saccharibacteria bacterium]|nr:hypothetical protein [Candidatus Saccharibacteria bacterium]